MIRIITDSSSDITPKRGEELQIDVMPLTVRFGEEVYRSGVDITNDEYYKKLISYDELPTTAQVNPFEFEKKYKEYLDQGDEIISIHLSSEISGTYQSAVIAKDSLETDKITIIDSRNVCSALGLLAIIAGQMRDKGASVQEITDAIQSYIPKLRLFVALETLDYVKKGGRVSSTVAFIGTALGLHPIVSLVDGKIEVVDKAKGKKSAIKWLTNKLEKTPNKKGLPLLVGHAFAEEKGKILKETLEERGVENIIDNVCMGPVVGTYSGPDAVGVFYVEA
ncbi:MAG TPA: DegV family protein [Lachnospiraceae bacterium]|jgi:DegV family protein with EDD domain|nr:DegV family protein [Lachnospiraceae bacterium]